VTTKDQALRAALEVTKKTRQTIARHLSPEHEMWWQEIQTAITLCEEALKIEPIGWATHHEEPMLFPTRKEALKYCDDDEKPIELYAGEPT